MTVTSWWRCWWWWWSIPSSVRASREAPSARSTLTISLYLFIFIFVIFFILFIILSALYFLNFSFFWKPLLSLFCFYLYTIFYPFKFFFIFFSVLSVLSFLSLSCYLFIRNSSQIWNKTDVSAFYCNTTPQYKWGVTNISILFQTKDFQVQ